MADDPLVVGVEELRASLEELKAALRKQYKRPDRPVTAQKIRQAAAMTAETWLTDLSPRLEQTSIIPSDYLGDMNVHFQRLLTCSERSSKRSVYDDAIKAILDGFTVNLIIPLKRSRNRPQSGTAPVAPISLETVPQPTIVQGPLPAATRPTAASAEFRPTAFVGHSFLPEDQELVDTFIAALTAIGFTVVTGKKPRAGKISEKVKKLIDDQHVFVGIFSRREKLPGKGEWATSPWVVEEKAYALAKVKKLILLKEDGIKSIGGLQGDYEFIEFSRIRLHEALVRLLETFEISVSGVRS